MNEGEYQRNLFEKDAAHAWIDGASSGNPGPAGAGVVIKKESEVLGRWSKYLGETTNNVAEYSSLLLALSKAKELGVKRLVVHTDSELVYRQLTGRYKVKNPGIKELYSKVRARVNKLEYFRIEHVSREHNKEADKLARTARKNPS